MLARIRTNQRDSQEAVKEWRKYAKGVQNNNPEIMQEWRRLGAAETKRELRERYGSQGDRLRFAGYSMVEFGPLTSAVIIRFLIKLGKALFYLHNEQIFDGYIYIYNFIEMRRSMDREALLSLLALVPQAAQMKRGNMMLSDQFFYRFNASPEFGVFVGLIHFSEQFQFYMMCIDQDLDRKLEEQASELRENLPDVTKYDCRLGGGSACFAL